jgi:hypothetical protein
LTKLGCALLLGAALAFPAGIMVAGMRNGVPGVRGPAPRRTPAMRDVFSPSVRRDPWFLDRQREGVEALASYCARTGKSCSEARAARDRLAELEAAE